MASRVIMRMTTLPSSTSWCTWVASRMTPDGPAEILRSILYFFPIVRPTNGSTGHAPRMTAWHAGHAASSGSTGPWHVEQ